MLCYKMCRLRCAYRVQITALDFGAEGAGFDSMPERKIKSEALQIILWYNNGQYA